MLFCNEPTTEKLGNSLVHTLVPKSKRSVDVTLAKLLTDVGFISRTIILQPGAKWFQNHSSSRAGVIITVYLTARNGLCCLYSEIQSVFAISFIC